MSRTGAAIARLALVFLLALPSVAHADDVVEPGSPVVEPPALEPSEVPSVPDLPAPAGVTTAPGSVSVSWSFPPQPPEPGRAGTRCDPYESLTSSSIGPAYPCDFPDPMVLQVGGVYYAYGTSVNWDGQKQVLPILISSDLEHWSFYAHAFAENRNPSWARGQVWAPSVLAANGRYYLYYSALRTDGLHCLAVATSASPAGPFDDRGVIRCRDRRYAGFIDPAAIMVRGRGYLFFSVDGPGHSISALRLDGSLLRAPGKPVHLLNVHGREHRMVARTVEAPWPVQRGRRFYLFYSTGCWCSDYQMRWAVADEPLGPYRRVSRQPVVAGRNGLKAPGSGSLITGPDGTPRLVYHAWTGPAGYARGGVRTLRTTPLRWTAAGPTLAP